jgi:hypothetical protein
VAHLLCLVAGFDFTLSSLVGDDYNFMKKLKRKNSRYILVVHISNIMVKLTKLAPKIL